MFIEAYRQAYGQQKQATPTTSTQNIIATKEGSFYYLLGGIALIASFFLPAVKTAHQTFLPFQSLLATQQAFKLLPLLYLLGLSTTIMFGTGRFRKQGIPKHVLWLHLGLTLGLILGTGIFFHWSLLTPEKRFGITLMSFALLCWWPLFIRLVLSWVWGKRTFLQRLLNTTWISAACVGIVFLIGIADVYYYKTYNLSYGLVTSFIAAVLLMIGGIKNEAHAPK